MRAYHRLLYQLVTVNPPLSPQSSQLDNYQETQNQDSEPCPQPLHDRPPPYLPLKDPSSVQPQPSAQQWEDTNPQEEEEEVLKEEEMTEETTVGEAVAEAEVVVVAWTHTSRVFLAEVVEAGVEAEVVGEAVGEALRRYRRTIRPCLGTSGHCLATSDLA